MTQMTALSHQPPGSSGPGGFTMLDRMQARSDGSFSPIIREKIIERAGGCCERCARGGRWFEVHHRSPRGMGGVDNEWTGLASNGLLLCGRCHRWVEANRPESIEHGWLVQHGDDPELQPVLLHSGQLVLLDRDGSYRRYMPQLDVALTRGSIATSW